MIDFDYPYYKNDDDSDDNNGDDDSDDNGDQSSTSISFVPTSGGLPRANVMASSSSSVQPSILLALTLLHFLQIGNYNNYNNDNNEQLSFSPPIIPSLFGFSNNCRYSIVFLSYPIFVNFGTPPHYLRVHQKVRISAMPSVQPSFLLSLTILPFLQIGDRRILHQQKCPLDQILAKGFQKEEKNSLLTLLQPFLPESMS